MNITDRRSSLRPCSTCAARERESGSVGNINMGTVSFMESGTDLKVRSWMDGCKAADTAV